MTTRRLADRIEYSQPVRYSHFEGKDAIVSAVALEGFSELSAILRDARKRAGSPNVELRAVAYAYMDFARANPALYEAMFALTVDLRFPDSDAQSPLHAALSRFVMRWPRWPATATWRHSPRSPGVRSMAW